MGTPSLIAPHTHITRSASGMGRGRSKIAFTRLKIAVVPPIPKATVMIVMRAKRGRLANVRSA